MTLADFHRAVRESLVGTPDHSFNVVVEVIEVHPRQVHVEWRVYVPRHVGEAFWHRGHDPEMVLAALKEHLRDERESQITIPPVPNVEDVGAPPPMTDDDVSDTGRGFE